MIRCAWAKNATPREIEYHDNEWGCPSFNDRHLFEMLVLEGAQAGLSWVTILKKRDGYKQAFDNFDAEIIALYTDASLRELLNNSAIVRNRLKIEAAINNARCFLQVREAFGNFSNYIWRFVEGKPVINEWNHFDEIPTSTAVSDAMARDLKKRGFKFVGATICYAYMQAVGMVNDHTVDCFRYQPLR